MKTEEEIKERLDTLHKQINDIANAIDPNENLNEQIAGVFKKGLLVSKYEALLWVRDNELSQEVRDFIKFHQEDPLNLIRRLDLKK